VGEARWRRREKRPTISPVHSSKPERKRSAAWQAAPLHTRQALCCEVTTIKAKARQPRTNRVTFAYCNYGTAAAATAWLPARMPCRCGRATLQAMRYAHFLLALEHDPSPSGCASPFPRAHAVQNLAPLTCQGSSAMRARRQASRRRWRTSAGWQGGLVGPAPQRRLAALKPRSRGAEGRNESGAGYAGPQGICGGPLSPSSPFLHPFITSLEYVPNRGNHEQVCIA